MKTFSNLQDARIYIINREKKLFYNRKVSDRVYENKIDSILDKDIKKGLIKVK